MRGRQPKSTAYRCDPFELCRADKLERILTAFPDLRICVPHLGFDETAAYRNLLESHDNLWLDTAMVLTDYFPHGEPIDLSRYRMDRVMYGSDFPSIPFAWDRELSRLARMDITREALRKIAGQNAMDFFRIPRPAA